MRFGRPDRAPYFEEGLRDEVRDRWRAEGLADPAELDAILEPDRREEIPVDWAPRGPAGAAWPLTREGVRALRRGLDADDPARLPPDWKARVAAWRTRTAVLQFPVHDGLFLSFGVGDWRRFEAAAELLAADPALAAEVMETWGEFHARYAARILADVVPDFATFSEPIGGPNGPLISPRQYRDLVLRSYGPALGVLRAAGVGTVAFVTYANARTLLRGVLDAGFDALWACEVMLDSMDYRDLRREFGPRLKLIGGIDLDALLESDEAVEREIAAKVPPLLAQGGYVPLADGRVRGTVPLARYAAYRRALARALVAAA